MATKDTKPSTSTAQGAGKSSPERKTTEKNTAEKKARVKPAASEPGKLDNARVFFEEAKIELKKVNWPTKKDVKATTLAVLALVAVMSIFLGSLDLVLVKAVEAITSLGR